MTDSEYVLAQLEQGPRDTIEILVASIRERGVGLTVHSRVADLRRDGHKITCAIEGKTRKGRERYVYRLEVPSGGVPLSSPPLGNSAGFVEPPASVERSGSTSRSQSAQAAAPLDVIPGQLRLVG